MIRRIDKSEMRVPGQMSTVPRDHLELVYPYGTR